MSVRVIRVGAVQIDCRAGKVQENLNHATDLVGKAARQGAQLVLLPELMPSGYLLTEEIWDSAEPFHGRTVSWLTGLARRFGISIGTSFLEAEGEDFYNTFVLAAPGGRIAGRVRKSPPASLEACFYRAGEGSHVIETDLVRIGVGICYENLLYERLVGLYDEDVDIVLQPAAAGRINPMKPGDIKLFDRMVERFAPSYARALGVPVVFSDRTGSLHTPLPIVNGELNSSFPGFSTIVDSDGSVKAKLGEEEGVIVADVQLDPGRKTKVKPRRFGKMWAFRVPWYAFIWPQTQEQGEAAYQANPDRRRRALAIYKGAAETRQQPTEHVN